MLGNRQKYERVVQIVREWVPSESYDHERKFQSELKEHLDELLNEQEEGGLMGGEQQKNDVVSSEHGKSKADIAVNDVIGIEMKRDLSNRQTKKLEGQINSYLRNYDYVIVCACGIEDIDGWRELQNNYEGTQGALGSEQEVVFIRKKKENYGSDGDKSGSRGDIGGGAFF